MDRPKRVTRPADPGYPTLADFSRERRAFLQRMALGGVSVGLGGGLLTACEVAEGAAAADAVSGLDAWPLGGAVAADAGALDAQPDPSWEETDSMGGGGGSDASPRWEPETSPEAGGMGYDAGPRKEPDTSWEDPGPIGGDDVGTRWEPDVSQSAGDISVGTDAGDTTEVDAHPDVFEEDTSEPLGGGAPAEQLFDLLLPATGTRAVYIADDGYLKYAVALKTYDAGFHQHLVTTADAALAKLDEALAEHACEDLAEDKVASVEHALRKVLEAHYAEQVGYTYPFVEALDLLVDSCELQEPLDGDVADPRYP